MKGWNGRCEMKISQCLYADRIYYKDLLVARVGRKVRGGRMIKPLKGGFPEFFVSGDEIVDRNYWLNLAVGR